MNGDDRVPSGFWTPYPVVQGEFLDRDSSVRSAAVQVPLDALAVSVQPAEVRACSRVHFALPSDASLSAPEQEEENDDDADSVVSNPWVVNKTVCLAAFMHDHYPESRPLSAPLLALRCGFELLFAVSGPPESTRPHFRLYPRVADIVQKTCDSAATLAKGTKPLSAILPKKRRLQSVMDEPDFATPLMVNPDFSRLAENKTISNKRLGTVSFCELERMEGCTKALLKANSFSFWLMSGLLLQLKQDGFKSSAMSHFLVSKHRESYLGHASLPLSTAQKRELLITLGSGTDLFDQHLIEKVSAPVKEDLFISCSLSLAKLAHSQLQGRVSPLHLELQAPLMWLVPPAIRPCWITLGPALPLLPGSVPLLPTEMVAVSTLRVAEVWLLF